MVPNSVDLLVSHPLLKYYQERNRSSTPRLWSKMTAFNHCFWIVATFLLSLLALWGHTFWFVAANIGFIPWFHAVYTPFRYIRLLGNIYGNIMYRCKPIPSKPKYTGKDVTVIIPTITEDMADLVSPFQSIIDTGVAELILVTVGQDLHDKCSMLAESLMFANPEKTNIKVYSTEIRNKRIQLQAVIPFVETDICALVDDDIWWRKTSLPWILAPFEDENIGSVGVGMAAHPLPEGRGFNMKTLYHYLGAEYLARRNFDGAATLYYDAGISCMSGRTNVLRTSVIKDPAFLYAFVNERDLSRPDGPLLMNGEDKFITRWLFEHGIGMWVQYHPDAHLETTLERDEKYLQQCIRWASSSWRGNYKLLFPLGFTPWTIAFWTNLKVVSTRQPWTFYSKYITVFLSHTLITDPLFFLGHFYCKDVFSNAGLSFLTGTSGWTIVISWYLFTKVVKKFSDLYLVEPITILFFPISLVFGLYHNWIKFTTFVEIDKGWRTRRFALIADTSESRDLVYWIRGVLTIFIMVVEWVFAFAFWITKSTILYIWSTIFGFAFYLVMAIAALIHAGLENDCVTCPTCRICVCAWRLDSTRMQKAYARFGYLRRCQAMQLLPLLEAEFEMRINEAESMVYPELEKDIRAFGMLDEGCTPRPAYSNSCDYFSAQPLL